jgi:hypothetical protein
MLPSPELVRVAKRMVWFKPPEETLEDTAFFLAHVMTYGTVEDVVTAKKYYTHVLSAAGGLTCGFCSAALQRSTSRCRPEGRRYKNSTSRCRPEGRRYKGVGEILRSVPAWSGRDLSYKAQGAVVADVLFCRRRIDVRVL